MGDVLDTVGPTDLTVQGSAREQGPASGRC